MPSSRPEPIPYIANKLITIKPTSVLDIGIGFGKWGYLAREYCEIWQHINTAESYKKEKWKTRIDGIEIFADYITPLQQEIYTNIYVGDAIDILPNLDHYNFIIASDILEHMNGETGTKFLDLIVDKCDHAFVVQPIKVLPQGSVYGNVAETHVYGWNAQELELYGTVTVAGGAYILEINNIN